MDEAALRQRAGSATAPLYPWMRPAWLIGAYRPGLRGATAADTARLRELASILGSWVLPLVALIAPLLLQIAHLGRGGPWTYVLDIDPWAVQIYDVFTESIPFMLVAAAVGLAAPAAGVLLVVAYAVGDLLVTILTGELQPIAGALVGRLVSYALLWLLAVEIPILARQSFAWAADDDASRPRRLAALALTAVVTGALAYVWSHGARLLIGAVFYPTGTGLTPPPVFVVLLDNGPLFSVLVGVIAFVLLAVRNLGANVYANAVAMEPGWSPGGRQLPGYVASVLVSLFILAALYDQPVDGVILVAGVLAARPVATFILRTTRTARLLARLPWAIRLLAGFAVTLLFASVFLQAVGIASFSRLGTMVIAVSVGLIIMETFLATDEGNGTKRVGAARSTTEGVVIGAMLLLALPGTVLAHDGEQAADAAGAAAVAGAAALAAAARRRRGFQGPVSQEGVYSLGSPYISPGGSAGPVSPSASPHTGGPRTTPPAS